MGSADNIWKKSIDREYISDFDSAAILKRVHLKSKFLYESVMDKNVKDTIYVL